MTAVLWDDPAYTWDDADATWDGTGSGEEAVPEPPYKTAVVRSHSVARFVQDTTATFRTTHRVKVGRARGAVPVIGPYDPDYEDGY